MTFRQMESFAKITQTTFSVSTELDETQNKIIVTNNKNTACAATRAAGYYDKNLNQNFETYFSSNKDLQLFLGSQMMSYFFGTINNRPLTINEINSLDKKNFTRLVGLFHLKTQQPLIFDILQEHLKGINFKYQLIFDEMLTQHTDVFKI